MKDLNISPDDFLRPFFEPNENVSIRTFSDKKGSPFKGMNYTVQVGQVNAKREEFLKHNQENRGIFFIVNYGGHQKEEIKRINAQFVECDNISFEEQLAQIEKFPFEPSIIVKTRRSLHTYWLVRNADLERYTLIQKKLVAHFDGDPRCVEVNRCMRLPGYMHAKEDPVLVTCVKFNPELVYTQEELEAVLPKIKEELQKPRSFKPVGTRKGMVLVGKQCDFIKHCKDNAATLPEHDWYAMISNLAVFEGGARVIHALSKPYPTYDEYETENKILHFLDSGTKPMTCKTIAEKGFKCPKLDDPSCGCKSPAALCYKPLPLEGLRLFLSEILPAKVVVEDIQAAKSFVEEYLYNIDPVLAESFISYEVKDHFGFKASDVKPLLALHKAAYRKYAENQETRRETSNQAFPEWYEPSEKGGVRFLPGMLADHMAKEVDAFYSAEQYYTYGSGVYSETTDLVARNLVRSYMIPKYATLSNITDAEGQWRMQIVKPIREINSNPYVINLRNGLYNVLDDSFKEHTPKYCSTVQLNVEYTPGAQCPRFMQFLEESLGLEEIPLIQEILGYFLIPINKAQKSFVIVGEPGAGKSKLLLTLNEILLGQKNVSNIPWQSLNDRFKTAELFGKLANIFADLPTKNIDDNGIFKALVGEDFLTVERKNKDPFSFQPYARLLFSCNSIPRNYGDKSEGFYRRLIIIRFSKPLPVDKRDADLLDKFRSEADGIFMFAVEGLKRLIANQYSFSETQATKEELQRYRIDSNSVLSFVEDCCMMETGAETVRDELFMKYKEYCHNAGLSPVSQKNFNKDMENGYPAIKRGVDRLGKRRTWKGIKVSFQDI